MKVKYFFMLLIVIVITPLQASKIIFLISPPRSLSVAFLRMMEARKDFTIFQEPFIRAHSELKDHRWDIWNDTSKATVESAKKMILDAARQGNVFVKEMGVCVNQLLLNDDLLKMPNVHIVFLLRNPHDTISSYYHVTKKINEKGSYFLDYQLVYNVLCFAKRHAYNIPLIIQSEDLVERPEQTIRAFCDKIGIPFMKESLSWNDLGNSFCGEQEWHENKKQEYMYVWHGDALRSQNFHKPRQYAVDAQGNPTFQEINSEEDRQVCLKIYKQNLPLYKKMLSSEYILQI